MKLTALRLGFPLALVLASLGVPADAETTACTAITSAPVTITVQGSYCLTSNISTSLSSGTAISINANNVTLDLNGFKLGGLGAGSGTQAFGIRAYERQNITIRNGIVRGFYVGILLQAASGSSISQGHVLEDLVLDQNTGVGIDVSGRGSAVRRNQV